MGFYLLFGFKTGFVLFLHIDLAFRTLRPKFLGRFLFQFFVLGRPVPSRGSHQMQATSESVRQTPTAHNLVGEHFSFLSFFFTKMYNEFLGAQKNL